jgi:hypothetical protein
LKAKITKHRKKKNDKDEIRKLPQYNLAQKGDGDPGSAYGKESKVRVAIVYSIVCSDSVVFFFFILLSVIK